MPESARRGVSPLMVLTGDRRSGRTTQAFRWVAQGTQVPGYPGWNRVLLLPTFQILEFHRRDWWPRLDDFDHRVYAYDEWAGVRGGREDVDVCIDDYDWLTPDQRARPVPGRVVALTMWARPWEDQPEPPKPLERPGVI